MDGGLARSLLHAALKLQDATGCDLKVVCLAALQCGTVPGHFLEPTPHQRQPARRSLCPHQPRVCLTPVLPSGPFHTPAAAKLTSQCPAGVSGTLPSICNDSACVPSSPRAAPQVLWLRHHGLHCWAHPCRTWRVDQADVSVVCRVLCVPASLLGRGGKVCLSVAV